MKRNEQCTTLKSDLLAMLGLSLELQEDILERLIILSIKQQLQGNLSKEVMIQITKKDCHQVDLVIQKKVLLVMALEKKYGSMLTEKEYMNLHSVQDLCYHFFRR